MFGKLFGEKASQVRSQERISFTGRMVSVPGRNLFGAFSKSPDGRYLLVWASGASQGGQRPKGRYLLLEDGVAVAEGQLERPNDGKVADNGVFLLHDWLFDDALRGRIHAFAADGRELLAHTVEANLYNNGLASDGSFAVSQTANADSDDGNKLMVFDLASGTRIARFTPELGWAERYTILPDQRRVLLGLREGGVFAYDFDGVFIEREAWIEHGLEVGKLMVIEKLVQEAGGQIDAPLAARLASAIAKALQDQDLHPSLRARLLRYRAEGHDLQGDLAAALADYQAALEADPRSGVKRRVSQLQKLLAT